MNSEELRKIALLRAMDEGELAGLGQALEDRRYADGQHVFTEGDPGDSMYFVLEGYVRIEKRTDATGAGRKILTVLEPGDYFGEMALLDQKPRSASAVAVGVCRILRLSRAAFDRLQQGGNAGLGVLFAMIRTSSERIRRLSTQLVVYDEVGKAIGEARDLQTLLDVILRQLAAATLADWGLLVLRSQFSEGLEVHGRFNLSLSPAQSDAIGRGEGCLGPVTADLQDRLIGDFDGTDSLKSCARLGFESASMLLSPITVEERLLGLIFLGGRDRDQFDLDALNLTRGIARQTAQAILNARHREEDQARSRHARQFVRF